MMTGAESSQVPTTSFDAVVVSGRGEAASLVSEHRNEIFRVTGVDCVPGSLNLVFQSPVALSTPTAIEFGRDRRLWQGTLNGVPVLVARWKRARQHICEIYSDQHLRSSLGLRDGDRVDLRLFVADLERVPLRVRLTWMLLWSLGRGRWFFSNNFYRSLTAPVELVLRSLQR